MGEYLDSDSLIKRRKALITRKTNEEIYASLNDEQKAVFNRLKNGENILSQETQARENHTL